MSVFGYQFSLVCVCLSLSRAHNIGHFFHLIDSGDSCAWGPALSVGLCWLCVMFDEHVQ